VALLNHKAKQTDVALLYEIGLKPWNRFTYSSSSSFPLKTDLTFLSAAPTDKLVAVLMQNLPIIDFQVRYS
jgi:hypothetical protein